MGDGLWFIVHEFLLFMGYLFFWKPHPKGEGFKIKGQSKVSPSGGDLEGVNSYLPPVWPAWPL